MAAGIRDFGGRPLRDCRGVSWKLQKTPGGKRVEIRFNDMWRSVGGSVPKLVPHSTK
jgi:hypothetical protein